MAANTLTAPSSLRTEQRREPLAERIWQGADVIANNRLQQAMELQRRRGETVSTQNAIDLARSLQARALQSPDIEDWPTSKLTANRVALLMLGIPTAARTQTRLDEHRTHNRSLDAASLSRFNDDFTGALAEMPASMMADFTERLMRRSENVIEGKWHLPTLNEKQFHRIANGLEHEVAVLRGLKESMPEGWSIRQGTTQEDMHGTDFVVYDPDGRELRLDVKSRVAFDYAVTDLYSSGRITMEAAEEARRAGVIYSRSRTPEGATAFNCIFDADDLGDIVHFNYQDPSVVFEFVERQFEEQGEARLRKLGKHAIIS